jgi:DNA-binding NarL/FixJ family response regulator
LYVPADLQLCAPTRIVIADDDVFFVEMLRTALLAHEDFEVVGTASNGQEAYDHAVELKPSVVLMDVSMPVLDGVRATRLIHSLVDPPAVVLITGEATEATDVAAYDAGAAAYLRKSEDLPMLVSVIVAVSRLAAAPRVTQLQAPR